MMEDTNPKVGEFWNIMKWGVKWVRFYDCAEILDINDNTVTFAEIGTFNLADINFNKKIENMNKNLKEDDFRMFPEYAKPTWMNTTTAYIPTTFPVPLQLNVGECWYIKSPNTLSLIEVEIIDVTKQTVVLKQITGPSYLNRYKKSDIEFVEKVEKKDG